MAKESIIQHYNSSVTGNTPSSGDLSVGEIAINTSDEKIFLKNLGGTVLPLSQTKDISGAFAPKNQVVSSFNGATGTVLYSTQIATSSITGVASFLSDHFTVSGTGHVSSKGVITINSLTGSVTLGVGQLSDVNFEDAPEQYQFLQWDGVDEWRPAYAVTSLNNQIGSVTLTGDGESLIGRGNANFTNRTATTGVTGVASFNPTYFSVGATGHVSLATAYQATGDTVITTAGSGIAISTSGKTDTLFNIGVTSFNGSTGAVSYAPPLASASVTGVAHFPNSDFAVSATGSVTLSNVARTNAANAFSGLQTFSNGLSAHGATFASNSTVRLSTLASHPQIDGGGGIYSGGSIAAEAVNNVVFAAGQGGSGEYPTKPTMSFQNNSVNTEADINFVTQGGDIKFTATTDIDIVAGGNVNISSAGGGIVIDPVTFVNIAGGLLYVDDTNNRVGINDTTPSMALCVNGGISGNSIIIAAGATFNSTSAHTGLATFSGGLTASNIFASAGVTFNSTSAHTGLATFSGGLTASGATFSGNVNLQDNVLSRVELLDYFERYVDSGNFTDKGNAIPSDLSTGQVFRVRLTVTGSSGLTVSNVPDNGNANAVGFTLLFVGDGTARVMTWNIGGTAVIWAGGTAPTYTSTNNKTDVFSFLTRDGGSTWLGFVGGQNF